MGSNGFGDHGGVEVFGALLIEIVLTFIFLLVILGVTDERNDTAAFAPLVIGLALAAIHFVGIPATGTSVNPARSIGVAFESGGDAIIQLWLFIIAPLIGAAVAGLLYPLIFGRGSAPVAGSGFPAGGATATVPGPRRTGRVPAAVEPAGVRRRRQQRVRRTGAGRAADHPGRLAVGPDDPAVDPGPAAAAPAPAAAGRPARWLGAAAGRAHPGPPAGRLSPTDTTADCDQPSLKATSSTSSSPPATVCSRTSPIPRA